MSIDVSTKTYNTFYINGRWVEDADRESVPVLDPSTEETIAHIQRATLADAKSAVEGANAAFKDGAWSGLTFAERAGYLSRMADLIDSRLDEFADIYINDQGGLASFAGFIGQRASNIVRYYAELGASYPEGPQTREIPGGRVLINQLPVGPVFASVPWNAPLILGVVKIAPALLAGCPVVVKMAPEAPLAAYVMAEIFAELGLPPGVISLIIGGREVGDYLTRHPDIAHVSFTGSTQVGREVAKAATEHFARLTLELGGKGASIFLDDINPEDAAAFIYPSSMSQSGQVCTTSSRLLVPESRYKEWKESLVSTFNGYKVGDPRDSDTLVGPLISAKQRATVEEYIASAREEGATILTGGGRPANLERGFYIEPTLVADVTRDMRVVREEVFGPVITLQSYSTEDEAVAMANDTSYGLANVIITNDMDRAVELAPRLRSGTVSINNFGACLTQPFGGFGDSGVGREGGPEGLEAYFETQQIQFPAAH